MHCMTFNDIIDVSLLHAITPFPSPLGFCNYKYLTTSSSVPREPNCPGLRVSGIKETKNLSSLLLIDL